MANLADGLTNTMDLLNDETDYGAKFLNPANDDVQNFVLQLLAGGIRARSFAHARGNDER